MGVKGLLTFLRDRVSPERVQFSTEGGCRPAECVLALDLTAFAIWVFQRCYAPGLKERHCDLCWAAVYDEVRDLVERFVLAVREFGLELEAFADGPKGAEGLEALEVSLDEVRRRSGERCNVARWYSQILDGFLSVHEFERNGGVLFMPFLFSKAVATGLKAAGVPIATAAGEADELIGRRLREGARYFGVVGNDSDFAVIRGCNFVAYELFALGEHVLQAVCQRRALPEHGFIGRWQPEALAKALDVEPGQLPRVALLAGNDLSRQVQLRCHQRGWQAPSGFLELAKVSLASACPTDVWEPFLQDAGERQELREVWARVQKAYAYGADCNEVGCSLAEVTPAGDATSCHIHAAVSGGLWPLWAWPVHLHGLHVQPGVLDWCNPSAMAAVLLPLWELLYALLRPGGLGVTRFGFSDSGGSQQHRWAGPVWLPLLEVVGLSIEDRVWIWTLAAEGDSQRVVQAASDRLKGYESTSALRKPETAGKDRPPSTTGRGDDQRVLDVMLEILTCGDGWSLGTTLVQDMSKQLPEASKILKQAGGLQSFCASHEDYLRCQWSRWGDYVGVAGALENLLWYLDERNGKLPFSALKCILRDDPEFKAGIEAAGGIAKFCRIHSYAVDSDHLCIRRATPGASRKARASGRQDSGEEARSVPPQSAEKGPPPQPHQQRPVGQTAAILALKLLARNARVLGICLEDFEALAMMAWILQKEDREDQQSDPEPSNGGEGDIDGSLLPLAQLGERYQRVLSSLVEVAEVLALGPQGQRLLNPSTAFNGRLLRRCSAEVVTAAQGRPRSILSAEQHSGFLDWHKEILDGTPNDFAQRARQLPQPDLVVAPTTPPSTEREATGLPIAMQKPEVLRHLQRCRVVCINGATGCGKSTQVPQYLLELAVDGREASVVVTQPRRMAAITLAQRVAQERGEAVGQTVGYAIGGESVSTPQTRLKFVTTGYLLQLLVHNTKELRRLTHIVLDEVHERSVDADMLSLVVKVLLGIHPTVRLVIMSATMNASIFQEYFQPLVAALPGVLESAEVPWMDVGHRPFEVREVYLEDFDEFFEARLSKPAQLRAAAIAKAFAEGRLAKAPAHALSDHIERSVDLIIELATLLAKPGCTVLVFLPGLSEITSLYAAAQDRASFAHGAGRLEIKPFCMHSEIPREDMQAAFKTPAQDIAHIVFASNIAESSLTLPNVTAVLDVGLHRCMQYDWRRKAFQLTTSWTSKASATQRSGRAGRTMSGTGVRLYTKAFHSTLAKFDLPEILEAPIPKIYLQAKELSRQLDALPPTATDVLLLLPSPPEVSAIRTTIGDLARLGALATASDSAELSGIGHVCLSLPFDLPICKLVWLGCLWGCAADAVVLACCMGCLHDPFTTPSPYVDNQSQFALAQKLCRSFKSRHHFDRGLLSEPLMLRALFIEWWRSRPATRMSGYRSWASYARVFAGRHAVVPRRLTQLVCAIADSASRALKLCKPGSLAAKQLRSLLSSLGLESGCRRGAAPHMMAEWEAAAEEQRGTSLGDWPSEWEEAPSRNANQQAQIFEPKPERLQALLAAAFSERLVVGRLEKKSDKGLQMIRKQGLDPLQTLVTPQLPQTLHGRCGVLQRVLSIASDGVTFKCRPTSEGNSAMATVATRQVPEFRNGSARHDSSAQARHLQAVEDKPMLTQVSPEIQLLHQFECKRKEFSVVLPRSELEQDEGPGYSGYQQESPTGDDDDTDAWPWLSCLTVGSPLLTLLEVLGTFGDPLRVPLARGQLTKRGQAALAALLADWPREVSKERGLSDGGLSPTFFEWLAGLFEVGACRSSKSKDRERTVKRAPSFYRALASARGAARNRQGPGLAALDEGNTVEIEFQRNWVQHPCRIAWMALWHSSADSAVAAAKALMEGRSPASFACHVPDEGAEYSSADFVVLGCCSDMHLLGGGQGGKGGGMGVAQGFTAFRLGFLPFWLLTAQLDDAGVHFGFASAGYEAPSIRSVRIFGKELHCPVSAEVFAEVASVRHRLHALSRGQVRSFADGGGDATTGSVFSLGECRAVFDAVGRLLAQVEDAVGSPALWGTPAPSKLAWCKAIGDSADGELCFAPLRDLSDLQQEAAAVLGTSTRSSHQRWGHQNSPLAALLEGVTKVLRKRGMDLNDLNQRIRNSKQLQGFVKAVKEGSGKGAKACGKKGSLRKEFFLARPSVFRVETQGTTVMVSLQAG